MGACGLVLGLFGLLLTVFACMRRNARLARARALRREVELTEVVGPRQAEAVRDDILNRRAGVERNSLEEIIAATERSAVQERNLAATVEDAGQSSRKGGNDDEWETLPPYAR